MKNLIIFLIASNIFALAFTALLHLYARANEKEFSSVNYLGSSILVSVIVIIYELIFEPVVEYISLFIESFFSLFW